MDEAHLSKLSIHPKSSKMYQGFVATFVDTGLEMG
jgi:hypothetical protein